MSIFNRFFDTFARHVDYIGFISEETGEVKPRYFPSFLDQSVMVNGNEKCFRMRVVPNMPKRGL